MSEYIIIPIMLFFMLLATAVPVIIGLFVYRDAKARGMDPLLWTLLAIFAPGFIGLLIYLIMRRDRVRLTCPGCGGEVQQSFVSCPRCGQKLSASCGKCGAALRPEWKLCPQCGAEITETGSFAPPVVSSPGSKGVIIAIITILLLPVVLIIIAVSGMMLYSSGHSESEELYDYACETGIESVAVTSSDFAGLDDTQREWIREKQTGKEGVYALTFSRPVKGEITRGDGSAGTYSLQCDYTIIVVNTKDGRQYVENELSLVSADPFIADEISVTLEEAGPGDRDASLYGNVFVIRTVSEYLVTFDSGKSAVREEKRRENPEKGISLTIRNNGENPALRFTIPLTHDDAFYAPFK